MHYGLDPNKLNQDNVRFDIFHLGCAITQKLMAYRRKFILEQSKTSIE